jgi:hypothetical protein
MKYLKILGLAAVAAAAVMSIAGAGSASATVLCSTTADPCPAGQKWPTLVVDFTISPGFSVLWSTQKANRSTNARARQSRERSPTGARPRHLKSRFKP